MLKIKYFKDYNHNYMILESNPDGEGKDYRHRMLASNRIEGLLKCSVRNVNGLVYFYYDISSKVSFENLYKGKQLSYGQVKEFFVQLDTIYRNLGSFFMEESGLLLRPDCVYFDLASGRYYGLYYPQEKDESENRYTDLMDFLLEHIDNSDKRLTTIMYQIYEMAEASDFFPADAMHLFDEPEAVPVDVADVIAGKTEHVTEYGGGDEYMMPYESDEENVTDYGNKYEKVNTEQNCVQKGKRLYYGIFSAAFFLGICAEGWVYLNFKLSQKEFLILVCCFAVMSVCLLFSVVQLVLSGRKTKESVQEEEELRLEIENEFRDETAADIYSSVTDRNMKPASWKDEGRERYEETVFIDVRKQMLEHKLYALDKQNKKHIELIQFPFTLGKMAGCVDCVLNDPSVSRLHARIEMKNDKVFLTDMNSTNGTYKNGLRMEPGESVEIEAGDEIRFGNLNYCYR